VGGVVLDANKVCRRFRATPDLLRKAQLTNSLVWTDQGHTLWKHES
jgi:hypothetical protein